MKLLISLVTSLNILLILSLLYVYTKNMLQIKSGFTLGLTFFALLFLVHNGVVLYFTLTMMPLYAQAVEPFMIVFSALQAVAFGTLNIITWK